MRAARFHEYGGAKSLVVEQAPDPHPGLGEIRVRVAAAGVNPIGWKLRTGALHQLLPLEPPAIPGRDAAGVVDEIGDGDRRALSPLFWAHVIPYGRFRLDMDSRLDLGVSVRRLPGSSKRSCRGAWKGGDVVDLPLG